MGAREQWPMSLKQKKSSKRSRLRLVAPFVMTLVVGSLSLIFLAAIMTAMMDRNSVDASKAMVNSVLDDRKKTLASVLWEYGFWNEAVENLIEDPYGDWVKLDIVEYTHKQYGMSAIHLIGPEGEAILSAFDGRRVRPGLGLDQLGSSLEKLIELARSNPRNIDPVSHVGYVGVDDDLFIAAAINLVSYTRKNGIQLNEGTGFVLIFAVKMDQNYLKSLEKAYDLRDLRYDHNGARAVFVAIEILDRNSNVLGQLVWNPELSGSKFMPKLLIGLVFFLVIMMASTRLFLLRITEVLNQLERAKAEAEMAKAVLSKEASQDALTGLGNRRHFEAFTQAIADRRRTVYPHAVMMVDLDGFKKINDEYGHEVGDQILRQFAMLLLVTVRDLGDCFRFGGDEFCVTFQNTPRGQVVACAKALLSALDKPQLVGGKYYAYGASIGIAFGHDYDTWLKEADDALYAAKRRGRAQVAIADEIGDYKVAAS